MDFLNKAIQQITDLFQQMTPAARITAGLLLITIVCSLFYLFRTHTSGADEYLFGGESFSQRDMANMETAFAKNGAIGSQIEGNRMKVPRGKKELFLKALRDNDAMPEPFINHQQKAVANDNPFSASASRSNAMKAAKERELARVVRSIKGIDEANVMYDETMTGSFPRRMERRASIAVKAQGNRNLTEEEVKTVRNMVIGAVGSLKTSDVTVVDLNAGRAYPGSDGSPSDNLYATTKRMYEENYRDKIATHLSMYPGVVVGVNVELDPEVSHTTNGVKVEGKPFDLQKNSTEKVTPLILNQPSGGRPGANPNALGNSPQAVATTTQTTSSEPATETRTDTRSMPSYQQHSSQKASLIPNSVTASVDIPSSYFVKVWKERNQPEKGAKDEKKPDLAELKKIEEETKLNIEAKVASILPPAANGQKLVTVTSFTELAGPVLAGPSTTDAATNWLGSNWQTLAMIGLAIGSLLFVRGMVNAGPPEPASSPEAATPGLKIASTDDDEETRSEADPTKRRFRTSGPNLRAELTDLVKEDPDTAANILKSWIGEAA